MTRRQAIGPALVAAAVVVALVVAVGPWSGGKPGTSAAPATPASSPAAGSSVAAGPTARPTVRPVPGHELYGFVPYWEMNGDIAAHLATTPLTTLALFSVTHTKTGKIDTSQTGYKRITGAIGSAAHRRGARPRRRGPARLLELRHGPEPAALRIAPRSRTRPSPASSRSP